MEGSSFNEARANCAGNYGTQYADCARKQASMRPAQIAREIYLHELREDLTGSASMRPAQIAREIYPTRAERARRGLLQ